MTECETAGSCGTTARMNAVTIKALAITEDPDRPTVATFVGLQRAGIDLTVIMPRSSASRAVLAGAGVRVLEPEFRDVAWPRVLRSELDKGRYDILHLFSARALQSGLWAARGLPIRIVAYRGIVGNVRFFNPIAWMRYLNPRIDRIVCVADAVRDYFLQMRPAFLRIPAERLVTIHKGHSLDWYTDPPVDLRQFGLPREAFVIGCVANYRPRKGIELLVRAMADLPESWQAHLVLVGHMDAPGLNREIARSPAAHRIHRVGYRADAAAVSAACDVFVLPSTKREGLARSLIEAMAYGVAPIVTDCGGSPEVVEHRVSGLVVPVNDAGAISQAISRLHDDRELRKRMGNAARERIRRHFRIEDTIAKTVALYRSLAPAPAAS